MRTCGFLVYHNSSNKYSKYFLSFQLCECEPALTSSYIALIWVSVVALRPASFGPCQILSVAFQNTECVELVAEKSLCFTVQLDESVHDKRNRKGKWKPLVTCRVLRFHHRLLAGDINTDYRYCTYIIPNISNDAPTQRNPQVDSR